MRTRDYHVLTNYEIEQYLNRNDVIFIPVGNAECHGPYPVDVEYVNAEAWARLFAEKTDALFLKNLIYLPAGATAAMRGTIQVSAFDAMHYMYAIARSLLRQGFRRQVYIPSHRQSELFMHPVIHQLMDDTKVPFLMLQPHHLFSSNGLCEPRGSERVKSKKITWGEKLISDENGLSVHAEMLASYQICGRLDDVPSAEELPIPESEVARPEWELNHWFPDHDIINDCSTVHCPAPFFYKDNYDHSGVGMYQTREEMKREADAGEAYMRKLVDQVDFNKHLDILRNLDKFTQEEVLPKNGDHLPENRWSY